MRRLALLVLAAACPAPAQAPAPRATEVADLEAMLARTDAALAALRPVVHPVVTFAQYDLRAILCLPADRAAPRLSIAGDAAGFRTERGAPAAPIEDGERLVEILEPAGDGAPEALSPGALEAVVAAAVGGDAAWADPCALEVHRGWLLVRQTAVGHARIRRVLADLAARAQRGVQLEVGFYGLTPALQQDLEQAALATQGVLSPEALARLDQAVAGGTARLASSAVLSAIDGQRVFLHEGRERAYVSAFRGASGGTGGGATTRTTTTTTQRSDSTDGTPPVIYGSEIVIGTGSVVVTVDDPVVDVLRSGLTLDVRPTLLAQGGEALVALDVRFVRSLAGEVGRQATPWGPIDTPTLTTDAVRTSALLPAGSGMLVFSARGASGDGTSDVAIVVRPRLVE